jgi:4-hydroxy-3-methylbut-2-enyl diphosphate reductase IspH
MTTTLDQIGTRLRFYMELEGLETEEMCKLTNTVQQQVRNILSGCDYCLDELMTVLTRLPHLNSLWIIYGEGNIYKGFSADGQPKKCQTRKNDRATCLNQVQQLLKDLEAIEEALRNNIRLDELKIHIRDLTAKL